jgi:hypothetical protein
MDELKGTPRFREAAAPAAFAKAECRTTYSWPRIAPAGYFAVWMLT